MEKRKSEWHLLIVPVVFLIISILTVLAVAKSGLYPRGDDTMYHVYRGEFLYNSIKGGDFFPLYDRQWYNGVELFRYWPPLTPYVSALCQALAGGDVFDGYLLFVGFICFFGALGWYAVGVHVKRPILGAFFGVLWFFMPNNLYALFVEGNLPRALSMIFLPLFIYLISNYLENRNYKYIPAVIVLTALLVMCHLGYAGMIALAVILYFAVYGMITGKIRPQLELVLAVLCGFLITGIWLLPSLVGGITKVDSSESMAVFFQSAWKTLNPFLRIEEPVKYFYFGLAAFMLAIFGIIASNKRVVTGFVTAIIIFLLTTTSMYHVLKLLPGGQYMWMLRFISIALCMIMVSVIKWSSLKKYIVVIFCVLLALDCMPSLTLIKGDGTGVSPAERLDEQQEYTLIEKTKEITSQRAALMDLSSLAANGAYLLSMWDGGVPATFGAGWEAAVTGTNIVQINRAVENGNYLYLFDRCKELGNDTVLVKLSSINPNLAPVPLLDGAAAMCGYEKVEETTGYILYDLKGVDGYFGTVTKYRAIGIGTSAPAMSLQFPAMEETTSVNLNDYTFDELKDYDLLYLAGFTYDDREYAEELVLKLSEAGVHVVIAADGIPEDRKTHDRSFLGVICNTIHFSNGYPELDTIDGILNTDLFPQGYTEWRTVYLEGLDDVWGTVFDNDLELDFYGTVKNEHIVMIGLNLTYHYGLTKDPSVGRLLSHAMNLSGEELPKRDIFPLAIQFKNDSIVIEAPADNVNTSLAYHDIFESDGEILSKNHLTYVNEGVTTIELSYPYFWGGLLISLVAVALSIIYTLLLKSRAKTN